MADTHVHVHIHTDDLTEVLTILRRLDQQGAAVMADLTTITASVQNITDVAQSCVAMLNQLGQAVRDAGTDPVALQQLADQLDTQAQSMADAVVANTPAAPAA